MHVHMYACMYACMHVCMHACVHVCMCAYPCMHVCMYACMHVSMYPCIHVYMYACIHVCVYVCMHACMHVCIMCVCMFALVWVKSCASWSQYGLKLVWAKHNSTQASAGDACLYTCLWHKHFIYEEVDIACYGTCISLFEDFSCVLQKYFNF
jgi:hypothetical protein